MAKSSTSGQGRPKGIPNKITIQAREAFQMAFDGFGGVVALTKWAKENPTEFLKLYGRLIPVDVNATGSVGLKIELVRFGDDTPTE